jgi:hypothetical protein
LKNIGQRQLTRTAKISQILPSDQKDRGVPNSNRLELTRRRRLLREAGQIYDCKKSDCINPTADITPHGQTVVILKRFDCGCVNAEKVTTKVIPY